jgi:hypothetical protein
MVMPSHHQDQISESIWLLAPRVFIFSLAPFVFRFSFLEVLTHFVLEIACLVASLHAVASLVFELNALF